MMPRALSTVHRWMVRRLAARPRLEPYPGWRVGDGHRTSWLIARLRQKIWLRLESPMTLRWLDDLFLHIYPNNETSECLVLTGLFEPNEMAWLGGHLQRGMTFIDVGANMGLYSLFAAGRVGPEGRVLAVEPSGRECEQLRSNLELNGLNNVAIMRTAAARNIGEAQLRVAENRCGGHNTLGTFAYPTTKQARKESVSLRPLDDIVKEANLSEVNVIKIDVEGAELAVLEGACQVIEQYRPAILIEVFDTALKAQGAHSTQLWQWLTQRGYSLYELGSESNSLVRAQQKRKYDVSSNLVALHDGVTRTL